MQLEGGESFQLLAVPMLVLYLNRGQVVQLLIFLMEMEVGQNLQMIILLMQQLQLAQLDYYPQQIKLN